MLQELSDESSRMGWKINNAKIKVMSVDNISLSLNNLLIENVEGYVYFNGQHSKTEISMFNITNKH